VGGELEQAMKSIVSTRKEKMYRMYLKLHAIQEILTH